LRPIELLHFRKYGEGPYNVVLVHGGPGAAGEMKPVAKILSSVFGVIEPIQTCLTVNELIVELKNTIRKHTTTPVVLIGFSWGAWLSIMLTSLHHNLIRKLILIGCAPLKNEYAAQISETRLNRLDSANREKLAFLLTGLEKGTIHNRDGAFNELEKIMAAADAYNPLELLEEPININAELYNRIWNEASAIRKSGQLISYAGKITCPVISIHGNYDPHPYSGVTEPLSDVLHDYRSYILPSCGHKPWIERYAKNEFYNLLREIISE
jgi:pimeloyl-ACP methyl ester carboxylesterase